MAAWNDVGWHSKGRPPTTVGPRATRAAGGRRLVATAGSIALASLGFLIGSTSAGSLGFAPPFGGMAAPNGPVASGAPLASSRRSSATSHQPSPRSITPASPGHVAMRPGTAHPSPKPAPASAPTPTAAPPRLLIGLGPEADGAEKDRLVRDAPIHMLTSWYNGPGDLAWMTGWRDDFVPQAYRSGYALHLIVYSGQPQTTITTRYGQACGEAYPLSGRFIDDMKQLARTFAGSGRFYVTLFTEFQTYACTTNSWNPNPQTNAYWRALKDQYMAALRTFHEYAPNSRISLGWGGWQTRWDDPAIGGGRSMFKYFADVMRASDFESFQAMQTDTNVGDVLAMTRTLGAYGPVMLAHYKPDNGSQAVFDTDTRAMLTDSYLRKLVAARLFAWSFMDDRNIVSSSSAYDRISAAVRRYGH
jgi:hypothetical protein